MFERLISTPVIAGALLLSGCSDDVRQVGSHTNNNTNTPYDVGDISGVWDISGSVDDQGEPVTGTLTINRDVFSLELGKIVVHYSWAEPELGLDFRGIGPLENFAASRFETESVSLGVIPLDLGGAWEMEGRGGRLRCNAGVEPAYSVGACYETDFEGYPGPINYFETQRVEAAPSIFGALGGVWNLAIHDPGTGSCTAVLRDTTVTAQCSGTKEELQGRFTFTLEEGVGSGSSEEGLEVSAVRR